MMGIEIPDERCERVHKRATRGREIEIAAPADAALSKQPTQMAGKRVSWIKSQDDNMKKAYVAVALTLLFAGCASIRIGDQGYQSLVIKTDPQKPNVSISDDSLVIDQEPIVLKSVNAALRASDSGVKRTTITWALPLFSDYMFPEKAVEIGRYTEPDGKTAGPLPQNVICARAGKDYTCSYDTPNGQDIKYKYSIMVTPKGTARAVNGLDPTIWN
jgi:hypothetical protein